MTDAITVWLIETAHLIPDWAERTLAAVGGIALLIGGMTLLIGMWMPNPKNKWSKNNDSISR